MSEQNDNNEDELDDINTMKVFSFEEIGKLISSRLDEVSEHINKIPEYVNDYLKILDEKARIANKKRNRYILDIILTSGAINGLIQVAFFVLIK